ncbi:MAG: sporulation protein [Actinobacteria bacterium]|nr:sporulation protein [Actinomycetota bacterium]
MKNGQGAGQTTRKILSARRVYGEPIERDGVTLIPAARIRGRAGGRVGRNGKGAGEGFRVSARPAGMYAVRDGKVRWMPALDVNRIIVGGQIVGLVLGALAIAVFGPRRWYARDAVRRRLRRP